ncbi:MAG: hypothetical protein V1798_11785 [Pseudomonadota bacterium]
MTVKSVCQTNMSSWVGGHPVYQRQPGCAYCEWTLQPDKSFFISFEPSDIMTGFRPTYVLSLNETGKAFPPPADAYSITLALAPADPRQNNDLGRNQRVVFDGPIVKSLGFYVTQDDARIRYREVNRESAEPRWADKDLPKTIGFTHSARLEQRKGNHWVTTQRADIEIACTLNVEVNRQSGSSEPAKKQPHWNPLGWFQQTR